MDASQEYIAALKPERHRRLWLLVCLGCVGAFLAAELVVAAMSYYFFGQIRADYLVTGALASLVAAASVLPLIAMGVRRQEEKFRCSLDALRRKAEGLEERNLLQARLEKIVAAAPGAFYSAVQSADGQFDLPYVSPAFRQLFGLGMEQVVPGLSVLWPMVPAADVAALKAEVDAALAQRQAWRGEFRVQIAGRGLTWMSGHMVPAPMADGSTAWYGFVSDITSVRRSHDELAQEMARRRVLFEQSQDGIVLINAQGKVEEANRRFADMHGCTVEEVLDLHVWDWSRECSREQCLQLITDAPNTTFESHHYRRDGSCFPAEVSVSTVAWLDQPLVFCICRDISERKQLENALRLREQHLRAVLDNFPFMVWLKDREGRYLAVNAALARACNQPSPEALVGKSDLDCWPPDLAQAYRRDDREVLESGQSKSTEEMFEQDGRRVWIETYKSPVLLGKEVIGTVGFFRDISDKKEIVAELEQYHSQLEKRVQERTSELARAVKDAEAFSYSVSHDLRAPLRAIAGYSRILIDCEQGHLSDEGQAMLDRIEKNGLRMAELIDDILDYSRAGRQKIHATDVDMGRLAAEVVNELKEVYPMAVVVVGPLPLVQGDSTMLRQVLVNLIGNALKFSRHQEPSVVEVGARESGVAPIFYVRDNGVGFDMQYANNLFGMFQRLHNESEFPGTGVGLAIVRRLLERHGGHIWAESEPGHGAVFNFTLGIGPQA